MDLAAFVFHLRGLGVTRIELELAPTADGLTIPAPELLFEAAPAGEPQDPRTCIYPGCGNLGGGAGGSFVPEYCSKHMLAEAGVTK